MQKRQNSLPSQHKGENNPERISQAKAKSCHFGRKQRKLDSDPIKNLKSGCMTCAKKHKPQKSEARQFFRPRRRNGEEAKNNLQKNHSYKKSEQTLAEPAFKITENIP